MHQERNTLDTFFSDYLGTDIGDMPPGHTSVVPLPRWTRGGLPGTQAYALWMLVTQSRCAISVHTDLLKNVSRIARTLGIEQLRDSGAVRRLVLTVSKAFGARRGVSSTSGPVLYCTPDTLRFAEVHECRRVTMDDIPRLEPTGLYDESLEPGVRDGCCFACWDEEEPVCLSGTLPVPHMTDRVADIQVPGTLEGWRGRGYGRTCLSHTTAAVMERSLVPLYATSDRNVPSRHTAAAVGYREYGWQFRILMPASD